MKDLTKDGVANLFVKDADGYEAEVTNVSVLGGGIIVMTVDRMYSANRDYIQKTGYVLKDEAWVRP